MKKKLNVFLITLISCILVAGSVFAGPITFDPKPEIGDSTISGWGNNILGYVKFIGWGIAFGMLFYVGIKYMMSPANEKANLKSGTINWVIGALVIGASTTIFSIVVSIFSSTSGT